MMLPYFQIYPIKIRKLIPPKDNFLEALLENLPASGKNYSNCRVKNTAGHTTLLPTEISLQDGDILFISAKVVAIGQGRCARVTSAAERSRLIRQEADYYLANELASTKSKESPGELLSFPFTMKNHTPVPFAGVDESNGNGWHILWPENAPLAAQQLRTAIMQHGNLQNLGLLICDSTVFPGRRGCITVSIGAAGLQLIQSYCGKSDLFGRELHLSESNIVDRLANFAGLFMGEGAEQTPAVVLRGLGQYTLGPETPKSDFSEVFIDPDRDFYQPLF